ncbi:MAG: FecR domain-containing protein [Candidatus Thiodiazotropha sp.]
MLKRLLSMQAALILVLFSLQLPAADWVYTVVEGDNLWNFSKKYLDSVARFDQLRKLNNIKKPKRLKPGSWLRVPMKWIRSSGVPVYVQSVKGKIELIRADGAIVSNLVSGTLVQLGDSLITGPKSSVALRFADGTMLTLHSDAEMRFDHLSAHGETGMVDSRLHLGKGRLETQVTPSVGPGSRFEIRTPAAITAVRGTAYRAAVNQGGAASNIEVLEGDVSVRGGKQETLVAAGFGTRVIKGQAPTPPKKLLPLPSLKPIPEPIQSLDWQLSWEPLKDASSYRVELSNHQQLEVLQWEGIIAEPHIVLPDLPDQKYWVRVRGIGTDGLEGQSVVQEIIFNRHPQPPVLLNPHNGEVLHSSKAELQWETSAEAESYRLEIATDKRFKDIALLVEDLKLSNYSVTELTRSGTYYWRVIALDADKNLGPASEERSWLYRPVPNKLELSTKLKGDTFIGSWARVGDQQRYRVQLAHDVDFKDLEIDKVIAEPEISSELIYSQLRYLRVCVVDSDGYQGPWSDVKPIDPMLGKSILILPISFILSLLFF